MSTYCPSDDEEYSVIGEKSDVGFLDFQDDESFHNFDPYEEGPIIITTPFRFVGKPQSAFVGEISADTIMIQNTTAEPLELWSIRIFSSNPEDSFLLSLMKPPIGNDDDSRIHNFVGWSSLEERVLQPRQTLTIWLSCKPKDIGLHTAVVHFDLGHEKTERVAFLLAEDKISQALFSKKPYSRAPSRVNKMSHDQYVAGHRPTRSHTQGFKYRLPAFVIPKEIREILGNEQIPDVILEGLNDKNYVSFFSTLIAIEEIHLEEEMRAYDMECVTMNRRGSQFLSLEVPGLAERRPSLVYGDYILAKLATDTPDTDDLTFQGYIHKVEADEIFLAFDKSFYQKHQHDNLYNVSFTYNRVNMRRLYQAVHTAENLDVNLLFPLQSSYRKINRFPFTPLNPYINEEQARSVEMILGCRGSPPYVIHGPPGTGKTMTLVEAMVQLYSARRKTQILVCASSNCAADHILEKLLAQDGLVVHVKDLFRLNAPSRPYEDVSPEFLRFCFFEDTVFKCPPLKALLRYKIIISTYMSASLLYTEGIRRGHFSHIFLDEAGQASEPETMVPLSYLCTKETVIVLAGDPKQLGPVVYSKEAERHGLGKSYLGRLFECEYYSGSDENYVTKLLRNYRCHPAILELPSKLFYNGELIACKQETGTSYYEFVELPKMSFPVLFVGIQGYDEREGNNPSWFNRFEASKVVDIIRSLTRNADLTEADIGVITPYRQQVLKLKTALELDGIHDLKVGSVEQFQGQEREIIIISTVRSTIKHHNFDQSFNLGFLKNPKRFNVAITRARSLLIIVGNPHIISKDRYWDKLLRYCADNGSYLGCTLPPPEWHEYSENESPGHDGGQDILQTYKEEPECGADTATRYSEDYHSLCNQFEDNTAQNQEMTNTSALNDSHVLPTGSSDNLYSKGSNEYDMPSHNHISDTAEDVTNVSALDNTLEKPNDSCVEGSHLGNMSDHNQNRIEPIISFQRTITFDTVIEPTGWGDDDVDVVPYPNDEGKTEMHSSDYSGEQPYPNSENSEEKTQMHSSNYSWRQPYPNSENSERKADMHSSNYSRRQPYTNDEDKREMRPSNSRRQSYPDDEDKREMRPSNYSRRQPYHDDKDKKEMRPSNYSRRQPYPDNDDKREMRPSNFSRRQTYPDDEDEREMRSSNYSRRQPYLDDDKREMRPSNYSRRQPYPKSENSQGKTEMHSSNYSRRQPNPNSEGNQGESKWHSRNHDRQKRF